MSLPQDDEDLFVPDDMVEDEFSWVELPDIATSPCHLLADCHQTLPDDMDIFAKEGWPEEGMWHLNEADTGRVDAMLAPSDTIMWKAQSDESLINTSVSLASTTRSSQACSFTLYHPQDVGGDEVDPAASGLHDNGSHLAHLEESGTSAVFTILAHSPLNSTPHDRCFSDDHEQLMQASDSFETLDEREDSDSDSILMFELGTGAAEEPDGNLDWLA